MVHWFKSRHTGNTVQCERPERHSQAHGFVANASTMPEIFEPEDAQRMGKARSAQRQTWVFTALAIICAIAGCAIIGYPYALQFIDHQRQARLAAEVVNQVDGWPYPKKAKEALAAARAYNKQLAEGGQGTLASALILLPRMPAKSTTNDDNDSASARDATYMGLLNASNDGIMGSIAIPQISVDLPIYHGTSASALARGQAASTARRCP